jgi:predicted phosphate transport protein (TIGR00153 family)
MKISLVRRERRFYDLFGRQGELVSASLTELSKSLLEGRSRHPRLRELEHACDEVTSQIYELVNRTFVAPMDQEDILNLASRLDDIVDLAEEIADKLDLYRVTQVTDPAKVAGECLAKAGDAISRATRDLEGFVGLDAPLNEIHQIEDDVDHILRDAVGRLFSDDGLSAAELVKWKDLYDLLENTADATAHVASTLSTISIKNA